MKFTYYPDTAIAVEMDDHKLVRLPAYIHEESTGRMLSLYIWFSYLNNVWIEVIDGNVKDFQEIKDLDSYVIEQLGADVEYYMGLSYEMTKQMFDVDVGIDFEDISFKEMTKKMKDIDLIFT